MEDYKEYLKIDKDNLDEECMNQPILYDEFASQVPDLVFAMDMTKLSMEECWADLYKQIVAKAVHHGEKKPTEKTIETAITMTGEYQQLQDKYYQAKKKAEKAKIVREAFMQKKEMIRGLIELHNSTYFSRAEGKIEEDTKESRAKQHLRDKRGKEG
tara:strand:- start:2 stop:472 length:471 start_codon:yes stop_codon:yes gene_type:complete